MKGIRFDVFSLQGSGVYTTSSDVYSAPQLRIQDEKLAESDGSVIVKTSFEPRVFTCEGYMKGEGETPQEASEDLDRLIDTFKQNLNKQNQNFDIDYAGSTRRYVATQRNMVISNEKGLDTAGWSVEFFCANPVGADITESTLLADTVITTSSNTAGLTVDGSYKAEPLVTVTVTSVTGGTTNKTITISNDSTLRGVSVTRDWANGDVLEIDCLHKTLYVNNAAVEFGGQFPVWEPGNSGISYLDDFTTRSITMDASYVVRYL